MGKKKHKHKSIEQKPNNSKREEVKEALFYILSIQKYEERKESSKKKANSIIHAITFVGSVIILALTQITVYSIDVSWFSNFNEIYSDLYLSLLSYFFITGIILMLNHRFGLETKTFFNVSWPFFAFLFSFFITKTFRASFAPFSFRFNFATFLIFLLLAILYLGSAWGTGYKKGVEKRKRIEHAVKLLEDNKDIVTDIIEKED